MQGKESSPNFTSNNKQKKPNQLFHDGGPYQISLPFGKQINGLVGFHMTGNSVMKELIIFNAP